MIRDFPLLDTREPARTQLQLNGDARDDAGSLRTQLTNTTPSLMPSPRSESSGSNHILYHASQNSLGFDTARETLASTALANISNDDRDALIQQRNSYRNSVRESAKNLVIFIHKAISAQIQPEYLYWVAQYHPENISYWLYPNSTCLELGKIEDIHFKNLVKPYHRFEDMHEGSNRFVYQANSPAQAEFVDTRTPEEFNAAIAAAQGSGEEKEETDSWRFIEARGEHEYEYHDLKELIEYWDPATTNIDIDTLLNEANKPNGKDNTGGCIISNNQRVNMINYMQVAPVELVREMQQAEIYKRPLLANPSFYTEGSFYTDIYKFVTQSDVDGDLPVWKIVGEIYNKLLQDGLISPEDGVDGRPIERKFIIIADIIGEIAVKWDNATNELRGLRDDYNNTTQYDWATNLQQVNNVINNNEKLTRLIANSEKKPHRVPDNRSEMTAPLPGLAARPHPPPTEPECCLWGSCSSPASCSVSGGKTKKHNNKKRNKKTKRNKKAKKTKKQNKNRNKKTKKN